MKLFENQTSKVPHMMQYNAETDLVQIVLNRVTSAGVDLSKLHAGITTNLKGTDHPDRILQWVGDDRLTTQIQGDSLLVRWRIGLNTSINPGCLQFVLDFRDDNGAVVWHDRERYLVIDKTMTAESLVAQYPSLFVQYETAMRKLYADAQEAVEQAEAEAQGAKEQANRAKAEADRAEGAREDVTTAKNEVVTMREAVATDKAAAEAAQKDVTERQAKINTAHEDVTAKSSAAQQAAEQISADKAHIDRVVDNFDTISKAAINDIRNTTEEAKQLIVQTAVDETAKIQTMTSQWTSDTNAQIDRLNADIITVRQEFASSVSAAQGAAIEAAQHEQAAQGYRDEAQAAADSVGDAISPALLTGTAAGTGAVTMGNTADYPLQSLVITGETQRDGTPEPANPVYPVSLGDSGIIGIKACGRNLLDWEGAADYNNWHTTSLDDDHPYGYYPYLIVNGFVPGVTYTIAADSIPALGTADLYCLLGTYPGANKGQANWLYHKTADALCRPIRTFVADAYTYYLNCNGCRVDTVNQVVRDWLPNLRIYQGSYTADTVPPCEPYRGQTVTIPAEHPIMRIGSAADTINPLTGDGLQTWGKIEFDGSERWIALTGSYANYTYCVAITGKTLGHQTSICSHHQNVNQAFSVNIGNPGMYCDHPSNTNVYFVSEKSTLGEFTAWLAEQKAAGTPVTLWYQLAQLTTYQVTPVSDLRSYDGTTTISVYGASEEPSPEIEVTAVLDATTVVADQQGQIDDLREMINNLQAAALAAEIGGTQ